MDTLPPLAVPVSADASASQPTCSSSTPRFDQLPIDVLSNVAQLLAPPFYELGPSDEPTPLPPLHVVASLDPSPPPFQTTAQALSYTTKTCSHVLEAARPWLWENVDVRSGRGWLAVVDALTEEVVDLEAEDEVEGATTVVANGSGGGANGTTTSRVKGRTSGEAGAEASSSHKAVFTDDSGPSTPVSQHAPTFSHDSSPVAPATAVVHSSNSDSGHPGYQEQDPAQGPSPLQALPSQPVGSIAAAGAFSPTGPLAPGGGWAAAVGTGHGHSHHHHGPPRSVSISGGVGESSEHATHASRLSWGVSPHPQPRRVNMLITPPGSRNTSPKARLRGRSRSPRRGLDFETEGITAVLQRSLSMSNPTRPLMRQSSLSHARVISHSDLEEEVDEHHHQQHQHHVAYHDVVPPQQDLHRAAMRTPPKAEVDLPPMDVDETPNNIVNTNPDMLPPPGPYIRHLSFTNFRTIGARRSQEEAVRGRFVTAGRLEGVIKNAPNLRSICITEYVDSALTYPVVEEIFFRGYAKPRIFRPRTASFFNSNRPRPRSLSQESAEPQHQSTIDDQMDPPRPVYVPYEDETEEQKWTRRGMFKPLEAIDLTGCVSRNFSAAVDEFGDNWLGLGYDEDDDDDSDPGRGRRRTRQRHADSMDEDGDFDDEMAIDDRRTHRMLFHSLRRLSLRSCRRLPSAFIRNLVISMPNLTHLDLSGTRVGNDLLRALTYNPPRGMRLESLSLARCMHLDPHVIVDFLIESPAAADLVDLNLFVNQTQGNAMGSHDLYRLITKAPCIKSGRLRYLDLSSAAFTPEHLAPEVFPPQPSLISLGLSHVPDLRLRDISTFLQTQAPGVEVITLIGSATADLRPDATTLQITLTLHALLINPLTTMPFSLSGIDLSGINNKVDLSSGPTRLRVVELGPAIRQSLVGSQGSGRTEWQVVRSKGRRGWYVDVSAGWIPANTVSNWGEVKGDPIEVGEGLATQAFVRHLPASHPRRAYFTALAEANGRVRSDVGWHPRKMEVVRGEGMMGREEGMGGVDAFAFDE